jgi:hypothetical protein
LLNIRLRQSDGQKFSYPFGVVHGTDSHEIISKTLDKYTKVASPADSYRIRRGSVEQRIHILHLPRGEVCEEYKEDDQLVWVKTTSGGVILFKGEIPKGEEVAVTRLLVYCCCKSTDLRGVACVQGRHSSTKCMLCDALPYQWADELRIGDLWNTERIKAELYGLQKKSWDEEMR